MFCKLVEHIEYARQLWSVQQLTADQEAYLVDIVTLADTFSEHTGT